MSKTVKALLTACALAAAAGAATAQEQVVNLYSARHYSTDEALYTGFTKATGIKINRVDADDAGILARLKAEDRIAFTYAQNPNGSMADIAGVLSDNRRVLGMMPHPERATETLLGSADGRPMFTSLMRGMALA